MTQPNLALFNAACTLDNALALLDTDIEANQTIYYLLIGLKAQLKQANEQPAAPALPLTMPLSDSAMDNLFHSQAMTGLARDAVDNPSYYDNKGISAEALSRYAMQNAEREMNAVIAAAAEV